MAHFSDRPGGKKFLLDILKLAQASLPCTKFHLMVYKDIPWMPEVFLAFGNGILPSARREKPLVQPVEFFENAGPMGCRFIFPESDFDPSNSIGSRNLSVLTSTLIGLTTESSSNRFSILLSTLFPVATRHNRNAAAKSRKSRS